MSDSININFLEGLEPDFIRKRHAEIVLLFYIAAKMAHSDEFVQVNGAEVRLHKNQIAESHRNISNQTGIEQTKVSRGLKYLQQHGIIGYAPGSRCSIITYPKTSE